MVFWYRYHSYMTIPFKYTYVVPRGKCNVIIVSVAMTEALPMCWVWQAGQSGSVFLYCPDNENGSKSNGQTNIYVHFFLTERPCWSTTTNSGLSLFFQYMVYFEYIQTYSSEIWYIFKVFRQHTTRILYICVLNSWKCAIYLMAAWRVPDHVVSIAPSTYGAFYQRKIRLCHCSNVWCFEAILNQSKVEKNLWNRLANSKYWVRRNECFLVWRNVLKMLKCVSMEQNFSSCHRKGIVLTGLARKICSRDKALWM